MLPRSDPDEQLDARGEIILFDWQTVGRGAVGTDLGYFLSALPEGVPVSDHWNR